MVGQIKSLSKVYLTEFLLDPIYISKSSIGREFDSYVFVESKNQFFHLFKKPIRWFQICFSNNFVMVERMLC